MKKIVIFLSILLLAAPLVEAKRKTKKTGSVKDGVYRDSKYSFELTLLDNWKVKTKKEGGIYRLALVQRSYEVPVRYLEAPDYTWVPTALIFVDTSTLGVYPFVDSLLSTTYKSKRKKKIMSEFDFLAESEIIPKGKRGFEFGGSRGLIWKGEVKYIEEVQTSSSSSGGKREYGSYGGVIFAAKHNNLIFVAHLSCEYDYVDQLQSELASMLKTLKWTDDSDEKSGKK